MYIFCITMICIASVLLILAVLVQSPKSGMAANFGAANQTMGVRQTTDFLEKFTWAMVAAVVFFSLLSTTANPHSATAVEGGNMNDEALKMAKEKMESEQPKADESAVNGVEPVDFEAIKPTEADIIEAAKEMTPVVETTEEVAPVVETTEDSTEA